MREQRRRVSAKQRALLERRERVFDLLRQGNRQQEIARIIGVDPATVSRDRAEILTELRADTLEGAAEHVGLELAKLDRIEAGAWRVVAHAWAAWGGSDGAPADAAPSAPTDADPRLLAAALSAYDRILSVMERRARLRGLDKPAALHLTQDLPQIIVESSVPADPRAPAPTS